VEGARNTGGVDMCKLSLILPSLNVAGYIGECLESVVNQTFSDMEIICVDAGSYDGTVDIIENYATKDGRIKIIHSNRRSYGYQMNLGVKAAEGDYIGIVETDDYVAPEMFSVLYNTAVENDVDFVKSGFTSFFDRDGERFFSPYPPVWSNPMLGKKIDLGESPQYRLYDRNHIWSAVYRRSFLIENELWLNETDGASFQDTSFSILVGLVAKKCVYIGDRSYHYRTDRKESSVKSDGKISCIVDEMAYIDRYIKTHNMNVAPDIRRQLNDIKISAYWWNLMRLTDKGKNEFRVAIREEMKEFLPNGMIYPYLSNMQQEMARLLESAESEERLREENRESAEYVRMIIDIGENSGGYTVVGAGKLYERFVDLQRMSGRKFIRAVCDNNKDLHGSVKCGYHISGVEEAVDMYASGNWLVLNKRHADDIVEQLCGLGIDGRNIFKLGYVPDNVINALFGFGY
jgi:glycosyltransferase involved in cell wall biosynthesis